MVGIIMGSLSDRNVMQEAADSLTELGVAWEMDIVSAHRTPEKMVDYAKTARDRGLTGYYCRGWGSRSPAGNGCLTDHPSRYWGSRQIQQFN